MSSKVVFVITGETRTWDEESHRRWNKLFNIIRDQEHQVIVQGYTWEHCRPPFAMRSKTTLIDYYGDWIKTSLKYEQATLLQYDILSDIEFFKNTNAQAWLWSYALNDAYHQHSPDIVFKIRWDELPVSTESVDQFISAINFAASNDHTSVAIVQSKIGQHTTYSDQVFGVNNKWLSDAFDTKTVDQYHEDTQVQAKHNKSNTMVHDHIRFIEYNNPHVEYNCFTKAPFKIMRRAGRELYDSDITDIEKCKATTLRPKT